MLIFGSKMRTAAHAGDKQYYRVFTGAICQQRLFAFSRVSSSTFCNDALKMTQSSDVTPASCTGIKICKGKFLKLIPSFAFNVQPVRTRVSGGWTDSCALWQNGARWLGSFSSLLAAEGPRVCYRARKKRNLANGGQAAAHLCVQ